MSQIPKPKPADTAKNTSKKKETQPKNKNNDLPKEEVERLINNAKDIDDLKDLLV